jgi:hypothetical protein
LCKGSLSHSFSPTFGNYFFFFFLFSSVRRGFVCRSRRKHPTSSSPISLSVFLFLSLSLSFSLSLSLSLSSLHQDLISTPTQTNEKVNCREEGKEKGRKNREKRAEQRKALFFISVLPFKCLSLYIGTFGYSGSFFQILIYF